MTKKSARLTKVETHTYATQFQGSFSAFDFVMAVKGAGFSTPGIRRCRCGWMCTNLANSGTFPVHFARVMMGWTPPPLPPPRK